MAISFCLSIALEIHNPFHRRFHILQQYVCFHCQALYFNAHTSFTSLVLMSLQIKPRAVLLLSIHATEVKLQLGFILTKYI